MYLLPILRKEISGQLIQFWLFLERNGTHCMEFATKEEMAECAKESGFTGELRQSISYPDLWIVTVDSRNPSLPDFYTWNEVMPHTVPAKELWRPYIWCKGDILGVNAWLKETQVASGISLYAVLEIEA